MSRGDFCLGLFLHDIENYKQLSSEETLDLVQKYKESTNSDHLNELVLGNIRFIISKAKRYRTNRISISDLIYAGMLGIARAAKKFDPNREIKFITYASYWIDMYMRKECISCSSIVKCSQRGWDLSSKRARLQIEGASEAEMMKALNVRKKTLINIREFNCDVSLNVNEYVEDEKNVENILPDQEGPDEICSNNDLTTYLNALVDKLKGREKEILCSRFGLNGCTALNMREISTNHNLTPERVRQILNASLKKLKKEYK